jgi:predicted outer membrane lipoprotein
MTQGCLWRSNLGLELANAFGVISANAFAAISANAFSVFQTEPLFADKFNQLQRSSVCCASL